MHSWTISTSYKYCYFNLIKFYSQRHLRHHKEYFQKITNIIQGPLHETTEKELPHIVNRNKDEGNQKNEFATFHSKTKYMMGVCENGIFF